MERFGQGAQEQDPCLRLLVKLDRFWPEEPTPPSTTGAEEAVPELHQLAVWVPFPHDPGDEASPLEGQSSPCAVAVGLEPMMLRIQEAPKLKV